MSQSLDSFPRIRAAFLAMSSCNGGINRDRTEADACAEADSVIGADGVYLQDLWAIDEWLGTLTEDEVLTFVDGEESEIEALAARGGDVGRRARGLFNDLFDEAV